MTADRRLHYGVRIAVAVAVAIAVAVVGSVLVLELGAAAGFESDSASPPRSWSAIRLPSGGTVNALAVAPDASRWYAANDWGVWRSDDGETWERTDVPALAAPISRVAAGQGGLAFVMTSDLELIVTVDGGRTWRETDEGPDYVVAARAPGVAYLVDSDFLYRSTDAGATWQRRGAIPSSRLQAGLAVDPASPDRLYGGGRGVFTSADAGRSWTRTSVGLPPSAQVTAIAVAASPHVVFAGTAAHGVFRSADGGRTWAAALRGLARLRGSRRGYARIEHLAAGADVGRVYAATSAGIATTADGGARWEPTALRVRVSALVAHPMRSETVLSAPTGRGIATSGDAGRRWDAANTGLDGVAATAVAVDPGDPRTVFLGTATGLYRSRDGGATWAPRKPAQPVADLAIHPRARRTVFAGNATDGVLRSRDGGSTWTRVRRGLVVPRGPCCFSLELHPRRPGTLYAVAGRRVFKTVNAGASWGPTGLRLPVDYFVDWLVVDPRRPSTLYAAYNGGRPHLDGGTVVSRDGGATWSGFRRPTAAGAFGYPTAFVPIPTTGGILARDHVEGWTYHRAPGATRWTRVSMPFGRFESPVFAVNPRTRAVHALGSTGLFEARPFARGVRWRRVAAAPPGEAEDGVVGLAFAGDGSRLYAYTGRGRAFVWR